MLWCMWREVGEEQLDVSRTGQMAMSIVWGVIAPAPRGCDPRVALCFTYDGLTPTPQPRNNRFIQRRTCFID